MGPLTRTARLFWQIHPGRPPRRPLRPWKFCIDLRRHTGNLPGMDADETEVCTFLKAFRGRFVSPKELARRAGGKWRYREDPKWAIPVLLRLVEKGVLECDASGYYRLLERERKKPKQWVSPQIKAILEKSGKDFGDLLETDKQDEFFE